MNSFIKAITNEMAPTDLSNVQKKYIYDDVKFDSLAMSMLVENRNFLLSDYDEVNMIGRYEYRPDYVSYDFYDTTNLWYVILYANDIVSFVDFNFNNLQVIKIPSIDTINKLIPNYRNKKNVEQLTL